MKILVTGGAGYIGSHMVKMLCDFGYSVVVVDSLVNGHRKLLDPRADFVKSSISSKKTMAETLKECDAVMHFAGFIEAGLSMKYPFRFFENNVYSGAVLLEAMGEANVGKIIFSSSAAVFGIPQYLPIDELHHTNPINFYGRTKLFFEQLLGWHEKIHGFRHISLRYFNAAGADESGSIGEMHNNETHLIPLALQVALGQKKSVKIFGTDYETPDGTCIRDYIHVNDICKAHVLALKHLSKSGKSGVFNLGTEKGKSVHDVISSCQMITGKKIKVIKDKRMQGDPAVLIASSKKSRKILGWKPKYTKIDSIVSTAWNWHSRNSKNNTIKN